MTKWQEKKDIFANDFVSKISSLKHIFPENFMKIDQETAEKIETTTRENNDNNIEKTLSSVIILL